MLELSALEARKSLSHVEPIALAALVAEVQRSCEPLLRQKGLSFEADLSAGAEVRGDRLLLRQALANLVHNAIQATPPGGSIGVKLWRDGESVGVRVLDSGPGVPEYALPRVFERFYSVPSTEGAPPGTGLGLPFVREVALLHGGGAALGNAPEGGAVAEMWIRQDPPGR